MEVLANISHPQIIQVYRMLHDEDCFYIASEICEGGELFERFTQLKHFDECNAAYVIR